VTEYQQTPTRVVPSGKDAVDDLTVGELDTIARKCGADVMQALAGKGAEGTRRMVVLAYLAFVWTKRTRPDAKVDEFLNMRAGDLEVVLGFNDDEEGEVEDPSSRSDGSASA
jgi:hypothetical protein